MFGKVSLRSERYRYLCSRTASFSLALAPRSGYPGRPARGLYLYGLQKGLFSCIKILRRKSRAGIDGQAFTAGPHRLLLASCYVLPPARFARPGVSGRPPDP